jgi:hypothetical protein
VHLPDSASFAQALSDFQTLPRKTCSGSAVGFVGKLSGGLLTVVVGALGAGAGLALSLFLLNMPKGCHPELPAELVPAGIVEVMPTVLFCVFGKIEFVVPTTIVVTGLAFIVSAFVDAVVAA